MVANEQPDLGWTDGEEILDEAGYDEYGHDYVRARAWSPYAWRGMLLALTLFAVPFVLAWIFA